MAITYKFSGHESFPCKTLWLKKGYDFVANKNDFNSPDAIVRRYQFGRMYITVNTKQKNQTIIV